MELKTNGWDDKECNELRTFICADEKLILVKEQKSWEEALRHCRRLVSRSDDAVLVGYELAFLLTDDDLLLATEKAQNADTAQVWTGLRYLAASWVWVGGEVDGVPLLEACPTQDLRCGSVSQGASSEQSTQCIQENNFLCLRLDILRALVWTPRLGEPFHSNSLIPWFSLVAASHTTPSSSSRSLQRPTWCADTGRAYTSFPVMSQCSSQVTASCTRRRSARSSTSVSSFFSCKPRLSSCKPRLSSSTCTTRLSSRGMVGGACCPGTVCP
ncbi:hypothetical protein CRUP_016763 [Coryphaenoides rupestris]|nr:hypothetical protein CRUP_016763 [Coryphaenoides rupestris]